MTVLVGYFSEVMTWLLVQLGLILGAITSNPLLFFFFALGIVGMLFGWVKSLIHA